MQNYLKAEAKRYKKWLLNIRDGKKLIQKAEFRSYFELKNALDAAGHVYVLGNGTHGQFNSDALVKLETPEFQFEFFDRVMELWKDRVRPQQLIDRLKLERIAAEQEEKRDAERNVSGLGAIGEMLKDPKVVIDPFLVAQEVSRMSFQVLLVIIISLLSL